MALGSYAFSEDGSLFAYTLGSGGSDWRTVYLARVGEGGTREEVSASNRSELVAGCLVLMDLVDGCLTNLFPTRIIRLD